MTVAINANATTPSIDVNGNSLFLPTGGGSLALQSMTGWRSPLINPNFLINQRYGIGSVTPTGTAFVTDRWKFMGTQSSKLTFQTIATGGAVGNSTYFQRMSVASTFTPATGDFFGFCQPIEADNVSYLNWGTSRASPVVIGFWVRSSVVGTYTLGLRNVGNQTRAVLNTYTINVANTWEYKTVSFIPDTGCALVSGTGLGMYLWWDLGCGATYTGSANTVYTVDMVKVTGTINLVSQATNSYLDIADVTFDAGNAVTPFMPRPSAIEIALCYRYYIKMTKPFLRGIWTAANVSSRVGTTLPVTMRVSPSLTATGTVDMYDGANTSVSSSFTATYASPNSIEFDITAASSVMVIGRPCIVYIGTASGYLELNSEL